MKFGVREIVDVVFKAAANNQRIGTRTFKKYQPVFMIDTATTSSLEQATTTVYAQGGKGYARLIAWEGEKTMTFTVTDALMSPQGLAVLTGAGLIKPAKGEEAHVHTTINVQVDADGKAEVSVADLNEEFGLEADDYQICDEIEMFATELDGSGAGINWFDNVTVEPAYITNEKHTGGPANAVFTIPGAANTTVQLDFYTLMNNSVTEVNIEPNSFGGYFYIEAQTLFRREDTGKDMAAEIIIPKAKVQSAFTFTMAASGDPSTFDFVMDAFPGYTRFDGTKKYMCKMQIIGDDTKVEDEEGIHVHKHEVADSPSFYKTFNVSGSSKVSVDNIPALFPYATELAQNQEKATVKMNGKNMNITIDGGVDSLNVYTSTEPSQGSGAWLAIDVDTGTKDITKVKYNGSELTAQDVKDAADWGLGAGHFILWIKADVVKETPKTFTLSTEGLEDITVTINVADAA